MAAAVIIQPYIRDSIRILIEIPTENGTSSLIGGFCRYLSQSAENSGFLDIARVSHRLENLTGIIDQL
jgi:hypothetical protein